MRVELALSLIALAASSARADDAFPAYPFLEPYCDEGRVGSGLDMRKLLDDSDTLYYDAVYPYIQPGAGLREADLCGFNVGSDPGLADSSGYPLVESVVSLSYADLVRARLDFANLSGADLRSSALNGATFHHANLIGAFLQGADLRAADFSRADLMHAHFNGAIFNEYTRFPREYGATWAEIVRTAESLGMRNFGPPASLPAPVREVLSAQVAPPGPAEARGATRSQPAAPVANPAGPAPAVPQAPDAK